jgi:hypothetical protein
VLGSHPKTTIATNQELKCVQSLVILLILLKKVSDCISALPLRNLGLDDGYCCAKLQALMKRAGIRRGILRGEASAARGIVGGRERPLDIDTAPLPLPLTSKWPSPRVMQEMAEP